MLQSNPGIETNLEPREAFQDHPPRIDPTGAWTVDTSIRMARRLAGLLQYLEDPAKGKGGKAAVSPFSLLPLAANLIVVVFPQAIERDAVQIILSDNH